MASASRSPGRAARARRRSSAASTVSSTPEADRSCCGGRISATSILSASVAHLAMSRRTAVCSPTGPCSETWHWCPGSRARGRRRLAAARWTSWVSTPARFGRRWPRELSGGERQRVAVARALAARPPSCCWTSLSARSTRITRADLQTLFGRLQRELGLTSVLVTHDLAEAHRLANRVAVLLSGPAGAGRTLRVLLAAPATEYVRRLLERAHV